LIKMTLTDNPHDSVRLPRLSSFMGRGDMNAIHSHILDGINDGLYWASDRARNRTDTDLGAGEIREVIEYRLRNYPTDEW